MGCIEIILRTVIFAVFCSLIETWDVLKYDTFGNQLPIIVWFNRNMGCIEITQKSAWGKYSASFNRNMGCIEIIVGIACIYQRNCLIETWDVLKCLSGMQACNLSL